jgi:hypothetical protein
LLCVKGLCNLQRAWGAFWGACGRVGILVFVGLQSGEQEGIGIGGRKERGMPLKKSKGRSRSGFYGFYMVDALKEECRQTRHLETRRVCMDRYDVLKEILKTYRETNASSSLVAYWEDEELGHQVDPADVEDGLRVVTVPRELAGVT